MYGIDILQMACKLEGCLNKATESVSEFCEVHKCNEIHCLNEKPGGKSYCILHTCKSNYCSQGIVKGSSYCLSHKCIITSCPNVSYYYKCIDHLSKCAFHNVNKNKPCEEYAIDGKLYCNIHKCKACEEVISHELHNYCKLHGCQYGDCAQQREVGIFCKSHGCPISGCSGCKESEKAGCLIHGCTARYCYRLRITGVDSEACEQHRCRKTNCKKYPGDNHVYCSYHRCKRVVYDCWGHSWHCEDISIDGIRFCTNHKCEIKNCDDTKNLNKYYCAKHRCIEQDCLQTRYKNHSRCLTHEPPNMLIWIYYEQSDYGKIIISDINNIINQFVILS